MGKRARIAGPDDSDMQRISQVLGTIGGQHVVWGAQATLDVWVAEGPNGS